MAGDLFDPIVAKIGERKRAVKPAYEESLRLEQALAALEADVRRSTTPRAHSVQRSVAPKAKTKRSRRPSTRTGKRAPRRVNRESILALVRERPRVTAREIADANNLLKLWPALWTFVTVQGVEPTNNAAERSLRGPVISRKLSHGTRTDDGEHFIERALSASVTQRLQGRSLFHYLADLLGAHPRGDPLPTLT